MDQSPTTPTIPSSRAMDVSALQVPVPPLASAGDPSSSQATGDSSHVSHVGRTINVKPVLKHHDSPGKELSHEEKKKLTWDEHAIEEHDQLRGTRMKIDEPNTPYTHYEPHHSEDEESTSSGRHHPRSPDENRTAPPSNLANQWNDISSKLQAVADKRDACPLSPAPSYTSSHSYGGSDSEDEATKAKKEAQKKEHEEKFKMMRKQHYNEVEAMRRFKAEHHAKGGGFGMGDVDDDDEEENDLVEKDGDVMMEG